MVAGLEIRSGGLRTGAELVAGMGFLSCPATEAGAWERGYGLLSRALWPAASGFQPNEVEAVFVSLCPQRGRIRAKEEARKLREEYDVFGDSHQDTVGKKEQKTWGFICRRCSQHVNCPHSPRPTGP